jgi:hypothetical protein
MNHDVSVEIAVAAPRAGASSSARGNTRERRCAGLREVVVPGHSQTPVARREGWASRPDAKFSPCKASNSRNGEGISISREPVERANERPARKGAALLGKCDAL